MKTHILFSISALILIIFTFCGTAFSIGPYTDNGDTVYDSETELTWQKADNGRLQDWGEALEYCENLTLGDYTNWRLPNIRELISIVDEGSSNPAISSFFQGRSANYWSSTSYASYPDSAWGVYFLYGDDTRFLKTQNYYVRCVRDEDKFDLSLLFGGLGSGIVRVNPPGETCRTDCSNTYIRDTSVTLSASPSFNSTFSGWSGGSCSGTGDCTVTMDQDQTITATFDMLQYTLTYLALNDTISGTSPQTVAHGENGTPVTAEPIEGYHFVSWSDDSTQNPRTDTNVTADIAVFAIFSNTYTLTYTAGEGGSISGENPQIILDGNDGTVVYAIAETDYAFVDWSDGYTPTCSGEFCPPGIRVDTNVSSDINAIANFGHNLSYIAGANGSISGNTYQIVDHAGNGTEVRAIANVGYHFVEWSDGSTVNPRTDTGVTLNIVVIANFAINEYPLTYLRGANTLGFCVGGGEFPTCVDDDFTVNIPHGGNGPIVEAQPTDGTLYRFDNWSDEPFEGNSDGPYRQDTNVTSDITATANFGVIE